MAEKRELHPDPITGEPGSHPVGTSIGSVGGAAVGAAFGAPFGPIGVLVGGAIGAVAGGAAGHAAGENIEPSLETEYWKNVYTSRPYVQTSDTWTDFEPAYRYGWEAHARRGTHNWDDRLESDLRSGWESAKGTSRLAWDRARDAVKDSWERATRTFHAYHTTDDHWRSTHTSRPYFDRGFEYDRDYSPAYRYGTYSRQRYADRAWDEALERDLERDWNRFKGSSRLDWNRAQHPVRDAWTHR